MLEVSTSLLNLSEEDYVHSFYNLELNKPNTYEFICCFKECDFYLGAFIMMNMGEPLSFAPFMLMFVLSFMMLIGSIILLFILD